MTAGPDLRHLADLEDDFVVAVVGRSMEPTLQEGDRLRVRPGGGGLFPGALVAFVGIDRRIWVHRMLTVGSDERGVHFYRTAGDATDVVDPPFGEDRLLGRIVAREDASGRWRPVGWWGDMVALLRHHVLPWIRRRWEKEGNRA